MRFADRDSLRDRTVRFASSPWQKQFSMLRFVAVATAILGVGSTLIYLATRW